MPIFRIFKLNKNTSFKKLCILYKNYATQNTKIESTVTSSETSATLSVTPVETVTKDVPELQENILMKPNPSLSSLLEKESVSTAASFDEVPGPKLLQQIAKFWNFIPVFGNQVTTSTIKYMLSTNNLLGSQLSWGRNAYIFRWMMNEYGPIVRLQGPFGGNIVVLSRPEDALSVFACEGRYPIRSNLDCLEKYRLQYRRFKNAGPFLMFGEDWEKLRKQIIETLNKSTPFQFKNIDLTSNQFITQINKIKNKQDEVPNSFQEELCKWSLECLCTVILGKKLGFMSGKETISTLEPGRLLHSFYGATDAIRRCESGLHLWKFFETPAWKGLVKNCDDIDEILSKYLREAEENLRSTKEDTMDHLSKNDIPLLQAMLLQEEMLPEDILTVFLDMMLIGVNATTHSIAFLFYHLARYPRTQRILYEEIRSTPEQITLDDISKMKYLKACIKESLRLKPPIPFLSRVLTKDTVISNYRIPKGTVILMATYLSSVKEENFDDALKFIPERWLNLESSTESTFACIPFGYGPKACLARNLAEMQLSILLTKVVRNFKIFYHYGDIASVNKLLAYPDRPLKFRFENRTLL